MRASTGFWGVLYSFWAALLFSVTYVAAGYFIIAYFLGPEAALGVIHFFIFDYGGLFAGTACASLFLMSILVLRMIPAVIEEAITHSEIQETSYNSCKNRFESPWLGLAQFTIYFIGGFAIYSLLEFPVRAELQTFIVIFTSFQYAFGGFIGRRLWFIGLMLRSIESVTPKNNLLETEALPKLIYVVNIFTFLTLLMTIIHTYLHARLDYLLTTNLGSVLYPLVYLPIVLAIPVIILFNFYPRMVVNRLYLKSIRQRKDWLARRMERSDETELSKHKHTIDYEKYLNEEFRYRQRVALSELPVALAITIAIIVTVVRIVAN